MIGPFGGRRAGDPGRSTEIKGWVARAFGLSAETPVTVMELRCTEPGCPPVETAIGILGASGETRRYKVHKPVSEVGFGDVERLAAMEDGFAGRRETEV
jgi:hypothetical protein